MMRSTLLGAAMALVLTLPACAQEGPGGPPPSGYQGGPPPAGYQSGPPPGSQGGLPPGDQGAPPPQHVAHAPHANKLHERFDAANVTHDGRLTLIQAQNANFKTVAKHFDAIDTAHHGYVTFEDLKAYHRAHPGHHHQHAAPPPSQSSPPPNE